VSIFGQWRLILGDVLLEWLGGIGRERHMRPCVVADIHPGINPCVQGLLRVR
jgi:hypothetical protein